MRLIFMGTPEITLPSLEIIHRSHHDIIAIFTQPDRASGRGRNLKQSPVKRWALKEGISLFQPDSLKGADSGQAIVELEPACIVAVAYGLILPEHILSIPPFGCINLHFSLLPKYRGAAPVNWAIVKGEVETGVTTFFMNEKMDEGDILLQEKTRIHEHERADSLSKRLAELGAPLLLKTLDQIEEEKSRRYPQDHNQACYAPMIKKEDGRIDWGSTALEISRMVRGFHPWPGAFTTLRSRLVKITAAHPESTSAVPEDRERGRIISFGKDSIHAVCGGREILAIKRMQPEGKKEMAAREAINGRFVQLGDQFGR